MFSSSIDDNPHHFQKSEKEASPEDSFLKLYEQAEQYYIEGEPQQALNLYKKCFQGFSSMEAEIKPNLNAYYQAQEYALSLLADLGHINEVKEYSKRYLHSFINKAYSLLKIGEFQDGFALLAQHEMVFGVQTWKGERAGRLLVNADWGAGDAIQFCRYLPLVKGMNNDIVVACPAALKSLFEFNFKDIKIISQEKKLKEEYNFETNLMSLPFFCKINTFNTKENRSAYLKAPFKTILPKTEKKSLGKVRPD